MRGKSAVLAGIILLVPTLSSAQNLVFSPVATETCLATGEVSTTFPSCIGASANACMVATEGGGTTVGMGGCLNQEWQYWDARLNAAYKPLVDRARVNDAEMQQIGATVLSQADALQQMQRAWIVYRDASCDYERSKWGSGTGGGPAAIACHMRLTATQAVILETDLIDY